MIYCKSACKVCPAFFSFKLRLGARRTDFEQHFGAVGNRKMAGDLFGQEQALVIAARSVLAGVQGNGDNKVEPGHVQLILKDETGHIIGKHDAQSGRVLVFILMEQGLEGFVELQGGVGEIEMDASAAAAGAEAGGPFDMARTLQAKGWRVPLEFFPAWTTKDTVRGKPKGLAAEKAVRGIDQTA